MLFQNYIAVFIESLIEMGAGYILFALPFFYFFWVWAKTRFKSIRIQEKERATKHHFWFDLRHSAQTIVVFALLDTALYYFKSQGYSKIYFNISDYGWGYALCTFVFLFLIGDTYFYWMHRAMHHPKLFRLIHRVHHQSTDPSPLTSFAFHWTEAVLENLVVLILPFFMPVNFGVLIVFQVCDMLNNVFAHLGYEIYPKAFTQLPFLKWKTASTHHNMHHQLFHGNYALYFTWWDKWMGTEFPDYEHRHQAIFDRKSPDINQ